MTRRSPVQSNHVLPSRQSSEPPVTSPSEEPAWKQRAVERSIKTAKLRAAQRVQRFLDAAQAIIIEKGSTDFTVQEVVDRSRQSLRSFYLQFDGKHELLLGALRRRPEPVVGPDPRRHREPRRPDRATESRRRAAVRGVAPRPDRQAAAVHRLRSAAAGFASRRGQDRPRAAGDFADRADGSRQRGRRTAFRHQSEADRRDDHADRDVHRPIQRRIRRRDRAPHHRRRGLGLLLAGIRRRIAVRESAYRSARI